MQENIQIQEELTMSGKIKAILYKSQPSRILGDRHCYIGLESAWETATLNDPFLQRSSVATTESKSTKLRLTMKFPDSSELYFQIYADNRGLALAYAPAFVQEIVDGLKLNQRVVWSCQGDNTIHITSAGRYKNIDMLYPNSLENKLLGFVGFGKGSRSKSIKQRWNEFASFFFDLEDDQDKY